MPTIAIILPLAIGFFIWAAAAEVRLAWAKEDRLEVKKQLYCWKEEQKKIFLRAGLEVERCPHCGEVLRVVPQKNMREE